MGEQEDARGPMRLACQGSPLAGRPLFFPHFTHFTHTPDAVQRDFPTIFAFTKWLTSFPRSSTPDWIESALSRRPTQELVPSPGAPRRRRDGSSWMHGKLLWLAEALLRLPPESHKVLFSRNKGSALSARSLLVRPLSHGPYLTRVALAGALDCPQP